MIRLRRDDFEDPHELAKFAAHRRPVAREFRKQFEYLIEHEPPPLALDLQEGLVEQPPASVPGRRSRSNSPQSNPEWHLT